MLRWPFRRRVATERLSPQAAYAIWAPSYPPRPHNRMMEIEQQAVLGLLPDVAGLRVLDAGCGSGRYLHELTVRGAEAFGIDLSSAMLTRARAIMPRVARADVCALPIQAMSLDLVVCALALGDTSDLELALAEIARVLRPGGAVIYSVVHPVGEAAGWSRSFDAGGRQVAIDGHWHSADRHRHACQAAGLAIESWHEPEDTTGQPVVLVIRARR
ncbi:MAG TPA: class I SAM-dependent methyltransferase [Vicinamibacterales bacterium]|nr:class I SAM-dependent methyltransferase [Vicinamibacterales bacterium]